ncbi:hypothetical protein BGX31_002937 [Mortierella sp. GBA43]|nr:hypothetical protein BGX31_002937 [Mortierella sp. GBA43]
MTIDRILMMPELAFAIQQYLEPHHLACAYSASISNLPADELYQGKQSYMPSVEGLTRCGHHVQRLNASSLRTQTLQSLVTHCLQLQHVRISDTCIPIKVLRAMLTALTGLKQLDLDLPMGDFKVRDDDDEEDDHDVVGPKEVAFLQTIERSASSTLGHLKLTFQTLFRMPIEALCSLLKNRPLLHTLKLVDVDIEKQVTRGRHGTKRNKDKRTRNMDRLRESARSSGRSFLPSLTVASSSTSEDEVDSPGSPLEQPKEVFGLVFLSVTSSHTSDASLSYVLERCSHLQALHLHSCDSITDGMLEGITQHLVSLRSISLSICRGLTPDGLDYFFSNTLQPLVHIHLCNVDALRDGTLEIIAQHHGGSLQKLAVYFCGLVTDNGVKALLMSCSQLRFLGLQAYGMSTKIFESPWGCQKTLENLDLQPVFKLFSNDTPSAPENNVESSGNGSSIGEWGNLEVRKWRESKAKLDAFSIIRHRLMTLSSLKNLRLSASGIERQVLGGFGQDQQIQVLHLYGLRSALIDTLPWKDIKTQYPYLKQIYCTLAGNMKSIKDELARLNIELLTSSIPDLAFENNFDDS